MMETLTDIPFSVEVDSLRVQTHVEAGSNDAEELEALVKLAMKIGRPKAAYTVSFVEARDGDTLRISGTSFVSRTLSRNLESIERVFPLVATCGREMDEAFPAKGDMLKEFWWDAIKTRVLGAANTYLTDHLHRKFRLGRPQQCGPGPAT
jgi:hypothetical protein